MYSWAHRDFICFQILFQTFKPVREKRIFLQSTVKSIFKQGLAKCFFHLWIFLWFYNSLGTYKAKKRREWLSALVLEQSWPSKSTRGERIWQCRLGWSRNQSHWTADKRNQGELLLIQAFWAFFLGRWTIGPGLHKFQYTKALPRLQRGQRPSWIHTSAPHLKWIIVPHHCSGLRLWTESSSLHKPLETRVCEMSEVVFLLHLWAFYFFN